MLCLHPECPINPQEGPRDWKAAIVDMERRGLFRGPGQRALVETALRNIAPLPTRFELDIPNGALRSRVLRTCPCLYAQVDARSGAKGVVHLAEVTMGAPVVQENVADAFLVQHPSKGPAFLYAPRVRTGAAGSVSEEFCREVLTNAGLQRMRPVNGRLEWTIPGFAELNRKPLNALSSFGDFLVPAAPSNVIISCKAVAARERLLNSGIRVDTVGFGFFDDPSEFRTIQRMNVLRRFGFTAIYMPNRTLVQLERAMATAGTTARAINVNGTPLFRPLSGFGDDMLRICGRSSLEL